MFEYETTHPWLTFGLDLRQASHKLWMLLGEAYSKCEHIAGVPLAPTVAEELHRLYLAKGAWATTAIEGNTLSEEQARKQLEGELRLPPSQEYLAQEVQNIIDACNGLMNDVMQDKPVKVTLSLIQQLNKLVLRDLELNQEVIPGQIRSHSVIVGQYRGAPHQECGHLLEKLCTWLNSDDFENDQYSPLVLGLIKAIIAHVYINWIHPFGDGNGRTARLIEFYLLLGAGVPTPASHLLSSHYNQTRTQYYRQMDLSFRSSGNVLSFVEYAVVGFVDGLRAQLATIRNFQWHVAWHNFLHESFADRTSKADVRRYHLMLDLSAENEPVPISKIPKISARVAGHYLGRVHRTLMRDLQSLQEMSLIEIVSGKVRLRKETILAFLPIRR